MQYTLGTAAKATGKSKSTIHRAIKLGKISATCNDNGSYHIEPSELHRVFPPVSQNSTLERSMTPDATHDETQTVRREIELLREERERERKQMQETISDLRSRLDEEAGERRRLTLLLTSQPPQDAKAGLWQQFFRRKA